MSQELEARFDDAMMVLYQRARDECNYKASYFLQMLHEHRGLETARILLHASNVSEGYVALWERHRLDLTVESVILADEWRALFSEEERSIARNRLAEYGHRAKDRSCNPARKPALDAARVILSLDASGRHRVRGKDCVFLKCFFLRWVR